MYRIAIALIVASVFLYGCGGGGSVSKVIPSVTIDWPLRTRDLVGPSSALSVKVVLHSVTSGQADVVIDGNRSVMLAAHSESYPAAVLANVGVYSLTATFYSAASQTGIAVATASANVAIANDGSLTNADGTPLGQIAFNGVVASVSLTSGQVVQVGVSSQLVANALDSQHNILALSPGSFLFADIGGGGGMSLTPDGIATGLYATSEMVTATVDGVTSPSVTIPVVVPPDFANPGFETPQLSTNDWEGDGPSGFQWSGSFTQGYDTWGVANGSGSWGTGGHSGTQYAFIQRGASMSQSVPGFVVGKQYQVTFWMARRNGDVGGNSPTPMTVTADGTTIFGATQPTDDGVWNSFTSNTFTADQATMTFQFITTNVSIDASDLLDDVHIAPVSG